MHFGLIHHAVIPMILIDFGLDPIVFFTMWWFEWFSPNFNLNPTIWFIIISFANIAVPFVVFAIVWYWPKIIIVWLENKAWPRCALRGPSQAWWPNSWNRYEAYVGFRAWRWTILGQGTCSGHASCLLDIFYGRHPLSCWETHTRTNMSENKQSLTFGSGGDMWN